MKFFTRSNILAALRFAQKALAIVRQVLDVVVRTMEHSAAPVGANA